MEIPGYKIEKKIGHGGMATVYLAEQESLERKVALKVMAPALVADQSFTERFLREGKTVAQLAHNNIIAIYDIGVSETTHYISMEYVGGGDLKSKIKEGDLSTTEVTSIIKQIATALGFAHNKGFIHRDIKPENILFKNDGTAVLTDFGIAKTVNSDTRMTGTGMSIGTLHYMSPEQARVKTLDGRSDLYSLGVVLYEMLTGKVPYDAEDTIAIAYSHVNDPIPELPAIHANFQPILDRLLAKEPENRFIDANELVETIIKIENGESIPRPPKPDNSDNSDNSDKTQILDGAINNSNNNKNEEKPKLTTTQQITDSAKQSLPIVSIIFSVIVLIIIGYLLLNIESSKKSKTDNGSNTVNSNTAKNNSTINQNNDQSNIPVNNTSEGTNTGKITDNKTANVSTPNNDSSGTNIENNSAQQNDINNTNTDNSNSNIEPKIKFEGYAILDIKSVPSEAEVFLNGELLGNTPLSTEDIPNGKYKLKISNPYFTPHEEDIELKAKEVFKREIKLEKGKSSLTVISTPPGAFVLLDEKLQKGKTPLTIKDVSTGKHEIKITMPKYVSDTQEVDLKHGVTEKISAVLDGGDIKNFKHNNEWISKERKIGALLDQAKKDMEAGKLIKPRTNNALSKFRQILKIDKGNKDALKGTETIARHYIREANKALDNLNFRKYMQNLNIAKNASPALKAISDIEKRFIKMQTVEGRTFDVIIGQDMVGPTMVGILPGTFKMGDIFGDGSRDEKPVHTVSIPKPFAISKYEITFEQYDLYVKHTGAPEPDDNGWGRVKRPVINISWEDAVAYTNWLSKKTGDTFRLPTEAEWEFAARAGTETLYSWGDDAGNNNANCKGCGSKWDNKSTAPVGAFNANPFGLNDMHGNVWEWILDCHSDNYDKAPSDGSAYNPKDCKNRVLRGGCWISKPKLINSSNRGKAESDYSSPQYGFRIVKELKD